MQIGASVRRPLTVQAVTAARPWLLCVYSLPLLRWLYLVWTDDLGANPFEFLMRSSGTWTLVGLLLTLTVTPLRRLLREPALVRLRRDLGLTTFFYGSLHLLAWAWFEQALSLSLMAQDVLDRPFVAFGLATYVIFLLLALTSNRWSMRRLKQRWKLLHRLIYVAAATAMIHYWLHKAGKNDFTQVWIYGGLVLILLGLRLYWYLSQRSRLKQEQSRGT